MKCQWVYDRWANGVAKFKSYHFPASTPSTQTSEKTTTMAKYTVRISIVKINEETGKQEHGTFSESNGLDLQESKDTVKDAAPHLIAAVMAWNEKDAE